MLTRLSRLARRVPLARHFSRRNPKPKANDKAPEESEDLEQRPHNFDILLEDLIIRNRKDRSQNIFSEFLSEVNIKRINFLVFILDIHGKGFRKNRRLKNDHYLIRVNAQRIRSYAFQPFVILLDLLIYYIIFSALWGMFQSIYNEEMEYWFGKDSPNEPASGKVILCYSKLILGL